MAKAALRNVVFIGETGSGKSSVINLIADDNLAAVSESSDGTSTTSVFSSYRVSVGERTYGLWDTPGLSEPSGFRLFRRDVSRTDSLKRFLQERYRRDELDLLVLCVRGSRTLESVSKVYRTFCLPTRQLAIPVVIAITHLERVQPTMEAWWQGNERRLRDLGLLFDAYACLTCSSPHHRRWLSRQDIHTLVSADYSYTERAPSTSKLYPYIERSQSASESYPDIEPTQSTSESSEQNYEIAGYTHVTRF